jgi:hypothetical protein
MVIRRRNGPDVPCADGLPVPTLGRSEEAVHVALSHGSQTRDQENVALAEIELCGELMIAAAATIEARLSWPCIDELLQVRSPAAG